MRKQFFEQGLFVVLVILVTGLCPLLGGDAIYGRITEVRSAVILLLDYGKGQYVIRLVGIDLPKEGPLAQKAKDFVSNLTLGKDARLRFEYRNKDGEMLSRVFTGDPGVDVGLELVRVGLARRLGSYDYKYGELSKAEKEARAARRGLWASARP